MTENELKLRNMRLLKTLVKGDIFVVTSEVPSIYSEKMLEYLGEPLRISEIENCEPGDNCLPIFHSSEVSDIFWHTEYGQINIDATIALNFFTVDKLQEGRVYTVNSSKYMNRLFTVKNGKLKSRPFDTEVFTLSGIAYNDAIELIFRVVNWANFLKVPKLKEDEKAVLRLVMSKNYNYIARHTNNEIKLYVNKPTSSDLTRDCVNNFLSSSFDEVLAGTYHEIGGILKNE